MNPNLARQYLNTSPYGGGVQGQRYIGSQYAELERLRYEERRARGLSNRAGFAHANLAASTARQVGRAAGRGGDFYGVSNETLRSVLSPEVIAQLTGTLGGGLQLGFAGVNSVKSSAQYARDQKEMKMLRNLGMGTGAHRVNQGTRLLSGASRGLLLGGMGAKMGAGALGGLLSGTGAGAGALGGLKASTTLMSSLMGGLGPAAPLALAGLMMGSSLMKGRARKALTVKPKNLDAEEKSYSSTIGYQSQINMLAAQGQLDAYQQLSLNIQIASEAHLAWIAGHTLDQDTRTRRLSNENNVLSNEYETRFGDVKRIGAVGRGMDWMEDKFNRVNAFNPITMLMRFATTGKGPLSVLKDLNKIKDEKASDRSALKEAKRYGVRSSFVKMLRLDPSSLSEGSYEDIMVSSNIGQFTMLQYLAQEQFETSKSKRGYTPNRFQTSPKVGDMGFMGGVIDGLEELTDGFTEFLSGLPFIESMSKRKRRRGQSTRIDKFRDFTDKHLDRARGRFDPSNVNDISNIDLDRLTDEELQSVLLQHKDKSNFGTDVQVLIQISKALRISNNVQRENFQAIFPFLQEELQTLQVSNDYYKDGNKQLDKQTEYTIKIYDLLNARLKSDGSAIDIPDDLNGGQDPRRTPPDLRIVPPSGQQQNAAYMGGMFSFGGIVGYADGGGVHDQLTRMKTMSREQRMDILALDDYSLNKNQLKTLEEIKDILKYDSDKLAKGTGTGDKDSGLGLFGMLGSLWPMLANLLPTLAGITGALSAMALASKDLQMLPRILQSIAAVAREKGLLKGVDSFVDASKTAKAVDAAGDASRLAKTAKVGDVASDVSKVAKGKLSPFKAIDNIMHTNLGDMPKKARNAVLAAKELSIGKATTAGEAIKSLPGKMLSGTGHAIAAIGGTTLAKGIQFSSKALNVAGTVGAGIGVATNAMGAYDAYGGRGDVEFGSFKAKLEQDDLELQARLQAMGLNAVMLSSGPMGTAAIPAALISEMVADGALANSVLTNIESEIEMNDSNIKHLENMLTHPIISKNPEKVAEIKQALQRKQLIGLKLSGILYDATEYVKQNSGFLNSFDGSRTVTRGFATSMGYARESGVNLVNWFMDEDEEEKNKNLEDLQLTMYKNVLADPTVTPTRKAWAENGIQKIKELRAERNRKKFSSATRYGYMGRYRGGRIGYASGGKVPVKLTGHETVFQPTAGGRYEKKSLGGTAGSYDRRDLYNTSLPQGSIVMHGGVPKSTFSNAGAMSKDQLLGLNKQFSVPGYAEGTQDSAVGESSGDSGNGNWQEGFKTINFSGADPNGLRNDFKQALGKFNLIHKKRLGIPVRFSGPNSGLRKPGMKYYTPGSNHSGGIAADISYGDRITKDMLDEAGLIRPHMPESKGMPAYRGAGSRVGHGSEGGGREVKGVGWERWHVELSPNASNVGQAINTMSIGNQKMVSAQNKKDNETDTDFEGKSENSGGFGSGAAGAISNIMNNEGDIFDNIANELATVTGLSSLLGFGSVGENSSSNMGALTSGVMGMSSSLFGGDPSGNNTGGEGQSQSYADVKYSGNNKMPLSVKKKLEGKPYAETAINSIKLASDQYKVPTSLISGLIQQESAWKNEAQSGVGAGGLMQIMPSTAPELGISSSDRFKPEKAIPAGTKYIRQILDKFNGTTWKALAGYNWGPNRKALQTMSDPNQIPVQETRDYVRKVSGYANQFQNEIDSGQSFSTGGEVGNVSSLASIGGRSPYLPEGQTRQLKGAIILPLNDGNLRDTANKLIDESNMSADMAYREMLKEQQEFQAQQTNQLMSEFGTAMMANQPSASSQIVSSSTANSPIIAASTSGGMDQFYNIIENIFSITSAAIQEKFKTEPFVMKNNVYQNT